MDYITDVPESLRKRVIWVVVDLFTKMAHFVPCRELLTAQDRARLFADHVFKLHGLTLGVISDRGTQFTSQFWKKLMQQLKV